MERQDKRYLYLVKLLKEELIPAMGCTEPIAISLATSKAKEALGDLPEKMIIRVSPNLIKNAKSVVVPNTGGMKGIEAAAAIGVIAGRADAGLEVISKVSKKQREALVTYLEAQNISVEVLETEKIFEIVVEAYSKGHQVVVRTIDYHTNIVLIQKDGKLLYEKVSSIREDCNEAINAQENDPIRLSLETIFDFANTVEIEDIKEVVQRQITYNMAIAEEGLKGNYGANIGKTMLACYGEDTRNRAIAKAAAGSDARMSGCALPVVINSGSGNQGITVSVPVIEYARSLEVEEEKLYRALVLSNLVAIHEKTDMGRLSAYCGAVSAGCAAGCGIAYLLGGDLKEISHTLVNSLAIVSGIICDGAKPSCAAKIASSIQAGLLGYHMYQNGQQFKAGDGIVAKGVEANIVNVSRLGREGMRQTDHEIVRIMMGQ